MSRLDNSMDTEPPGPNILFSAYYPPHSDVVGGGHCSGDLTMTMSDEREHVATATELLTGPGLGTVLFRGVWASSSSSPLGTVLPWPCSINMLGLYLDKSTDML